MAYSVYIIELGDAAKVVGRVRSANPDMDPALPALYIGQTATDPEVRFQQHKWGHRASRVVRNFGLHLWPGAEDIPGLKDIPVRDEAERMEAAVVRDLRKKGHCVWSH